MPPSTPLSTEAFFLSLFLLMLIGGWCIGVLGGVLGVGGGVFLIPFLVEFVGLTPLESVGLSLLCVIGTSVGSSSRALRSTDVNIGLGFIVEVCMVVGSVGAALVASRMSSVWLLRLFGLLTGSLALLFVWRAMRPAPACPPTSDAAAHWLDGEVVEPGCAPARYRLQRPVLSSVMVLGTGVASGLFGIGGGMLNVPILSVVGRIPLRAAAATSAFAMALSGAAGAAVHVSNGTVPVLLSVPLLVGVIPGGRSGTLLQAKFTTRTLQLLFAALAAAVGAWSIWRSFTGAT